MKKVLLAAVLVVIIALALAGCNPTRDEFTRDLDASITQAGGRYDEVYEKFLSLDRYAYDAEVYLEEMANYDAEGRRFPDEDSGGKNWYKPSFSYGFVKNGGAEYVRLTYTPHLKNGEGFYESYGAEVVYEFWYEGGSLEQIKVDGAVVSEVPADKREGYDLFREYFTANGSVENIAASIMAEYADMEERKASIAAARAEDILGKHLVNYLTYDFRLRGSEEWQGWRALSEDESETAVTGFDEDLRVDWEHADYMRLGNMCVTVQKEKITTIELYNEIIGAYHKTEEQAWNNISADNWYGDRVEADSLILTLRYDGKDGSVTVPAM